MQNGICPTDQTSDSIRIADLAEASHYVGALKQVHLRRPFQPPECSAGRIQIGENLRNLAFKPTVASRKSPRLCLSVALSALNSLCLDSAEGDR